LQRSTQAQLLRRPYGLSFAIEELILVRGWAAERQLRLAVALDHMADGLEFEEMLIISAPNRRQPTLTLWRIDTGILAQTEQGPPRYFATISDMLAAIRPARKRRTSWRQWLGITQ
jgi:hypothetical protein